MNTFSHSRTIVAMTGILSLLLTSTVFAAEKPKSEKEIFSYAIGYQIGQTFKRDGFEVDTSTMSQAIEDVMKDKAPSLTMEEMRSAMENAQKMLVAKQQAKADQAKAMGSKFLSENSKKDGVVTRDSGLQYKVISTGKGKQATATGSITAHYEGKLINGEVFDSSYRRGEPATFNVNQVIKGWQEVLPLMREGDKWQVFIPANLAYGERGQGPIIGPNETLVFDIELVKVN